MTGIPYFINHASTSNQDRNLFTVNRSRSCGPNLITLVNLEIVVTNLITLLLALIKKEELPSKP